MPLKRLRAHALFIVLLAGGCAAQPGTLPPAASLTGDAGLTADDIIDGVDLATGADGSVHVVWLERTHVYSGLDRHQRVVYRSGSGVAPQWGRRIVVADGGGLDNPQVVAASDGVHVFAGSRLHHWWLPAGSDAFRDLGDMLGDADPVAGAFAAIAVGDGITLAFTPSYDRGDATVWSLRWAAGHGGHPLAIATLARGRSAGRIRPVLHAYGTRLMLLWANTGYVDVLAARPGLVQTVDPGMNLYAAWSGDGLNWTGSERLASIDSASTLALASAGRPEAPVVFFAADGLFESGLDAGAWTSPMQIARYKPGALSGSAETSAVAATQCKGKTVVAWVDARHRRSDRRWWNPMGGFPWGDNPDWSNNDMFVAMGVPQASNATAAVVPIRLTAQDSLTKDIAIAEHDGRLLVLRTGRARVHKAPNDAGAPPEVTQLSLPCD